MHGAVDTYFDTTVVITVLVLLGQVLELRARHRTGEAIRQLLGLAPKTARLVRNGHEDDVPLEQVAHCRLPAPPSQRAVEGDTSNQRATFGMLRYQSRPRQNKYG